MLWTAASGAEGIGLLGGADAAHVYVIGTAQAGTPELRAHRLADGSVAWRAHVGPACSPILTDGQTVVCPSDRLYAYDAASGAQLWDFEPVAPLYGAEGALAQGRVFSASGEYATSSVLYAHDARTGAVLWERTFTAPTWDNIEIEAIVADGAEIIVSIDAHTRRFETYGTGVLIGVDAATGAERWRYENGDGATPDPCEASGVSVYRGPGAPEAGLILYVNPAGNGCPEGSFIALDRRTRALVYQIAAAPNWGSSGQAPIVRDGVAYATWNDGSTYAWDAASGAVRWRAQPQGSGSAFSHAVCGGVVLASNRSTDVLDRQSGRLLGALHGADYEEYAAQVSVLGDRLFLATNERVTAYACP